MSGGKPIIATFRTECPLFRPANRPGLRIFFKKIRKNVKKEASDRFKKQGDGLYYETIIAEPK